MPCFMEEIFTRLIWAIGIAISLIGIVTSMQSFRIQVQKKLPTFDELNEIE